MDGKFTEKAERALKIAQEVAMKLGHDYVGTEHLLLGLVAEGSGVAARVLQAQGVTPEKVIEEIEALIGKGPNTLTQTSGFTPRTKRVIELSIREAKGQGSNYIGTEHLLIGIMREGESVAVRILIDLGVDPQKLIADIIKLLRDNSAGQGTGQGMESADGNGMNGAAGGIYGGAGGAADGRSGGGAGINYGVPTPTLNQFGHDLTQMAAEGKFDPIIGREKEIERVVQILCRRTKNNPCLIGEPGVGKTAIAEGLAQKIVDGSIPEILKGKRVVTLDLSSMVAGSKYRGEFEERLKKSLDEIKKAGNILLFIDEMHTIIGAGAAEGAIDAANILKPSLSRGEIQVIGATTIDEYRKHIEKDAGLERRFQPIIVGEPSKEETIEILKGLRDKYEAHHRVKITDAALLAAVKFSDRYITDRFLPDKAIDLIDEAASRIRVRSFTAPQDLKSLEEQLDKLGKEKEEAINLQEFEKAATIRDKEQNLKADLEKTRNEWKQQNQIQAGIVDEDEIAGIVASWTGIPVQRLTEDEQERLKNMEVVLHKRVIGQDEAVKAVSKAIRRGRVGLKDPRRPTGSFIFLGPTGVGKTELCKALAEAIFGDENAMIRIDMSEYMEKFTVSRLVGSPPGYVGYEEGGQLTEKVRRKPYSVILFDEIEKAHPDVFNILLQILEDGHLTDSKGRTVDFRNAVIIMTSNVGARMITEPKKLGFMTAEVNKAKDYQDMKTNIIGELKKTFRPEFLNRVDEVIVFHPLDEEQIRQIVALMIDSLAKRLAQNNIKIEALPEVVSHLAAKGFDPVYGARPLRRAIQGLIEDRLAEEMLEGRVKAGDHVVLGLEGEVITFTSQ
ncbi:MAG: ATP-dependent Clp protease ATP-binding subunit [Clostridiales bacterium]|nr:ATP-dependent Clp protease ATP-binding subunit [Clostridiales bacterium]